MGNKQNKFEDPTNVVPSSAATNTNNIDDPRSPNGCRTPIIMPSSSSDNPLDILRKRFFRGFTYNMHDPRSPSLNRTPMIFDDSYERTLNLDDTFADLFVGPSVPNTANDFEMGETPKDRQPTSEMAKKPATPIISQQKFDPRSPSIGVDRTPIIFNDDENDAVNDDVMLENILSTLTLNLNDSGTSLKSADINGDSGEAVNHRPSNRNVDRIRLGQKVIPKGPHRRQKRAIRQKIYEDRENQPSTPQIKSSNTNIDSPKCKRTPLSCVRNSSQVRSRSVESSTRSMSVKTNLPLMSFDDTLNPNENTKVSNIRGFRHQAQDSMLY